MPTPDTPDVDPQLVKAFERALMAVKAAVSTVKLYPKDSPLCQQTLQGALEPIAALLQDIEEIRVSEAENGLTLNGTHPLQVKGFRELMLPHKIRNIKFIKGLTPLDIGALCEGLGKKKEDLAQYPDFNAFLTAQGASLVQTDEIRYIDVKENEHVVIRGQGGQISASGPGNTMQSVRDAMTQMSQVSDASMQAAMRDGMVKDMSKLSPEQLQEILTSPDAQSGPLADMTEQVMQNMPLNRIEEILRFIAEKQHQIKVQVQSQSDRSQRLSLLKTFMRQVLNAPSSKEISPQLYQYLSSLGLLEHVSGSNMKPSEYFSFTAVAKNLMDLPANFLVTDPLREHVFELVKNLCVRGTDESIRELVDKILENLDSFEESIKPSAVESLAKIHSILIANNKTEQSDRLMETLSELLDGERTLTVYTQIATALSSVAMDQLVHWRYDQAASLLGQIRRHSREEFAFPSGRFDQAKQVLKKFSQRAVDALSADLAADQPEHPRGALKVLIQLGEEAIEPLLEILRRAATPRAQQAIMQAMEGMGPGGHKMLLEGLNITTPAKQLVQMLPLLAASASDAMLPKLIPLLQHPSGFVRREVIGLMTRMKDKRLPGLLIPFLKDPDPYAQDAVIRYIIQQRPAEAVGMLVEQFPRLSPLLQEGVCLALGSLRNPVGLPLLIECLTGSTGFFSKKPTYQPAVRARAVSALGYFLPDPKAKKALTAASQDADPLVQQTAQQVLRPAA